MSTSHESSAPVPPTGATPETDALHNKHAPVDAPEFCYEIMLHYARTLERQRDKARREAEALRVEYESRAAWIAKMNAILGYDNTDGFHSKPDPFEIATSLRTQLATANAAVVEAKRELETAKKSLVIWTGGCPPKHIATEWFLAVTKHRDRLVLTALPEERSYQFKTADETYIKAENIVKWAQFPTSEFRTPLEDAEKTITELRAELSALRAPVAPSERAVNRTPVEQAFDTMAAQRGLSSPPSSGASEAANAIACFFVGNNDCSLDEGRAKALAILTKHGLGVSEDTARLDWLEKNAEELFADRADDAKGGWFCVRQTVPISKDRPLGEYACRSGENLRAAIDAARNTQPNPA